MSKVHSIYLMRYPTTTKIGETMVPPRHLDMALPADVEFAKTLVIVAARALQPPSRCTYNVVMATINYERAWVVQCRIARQFAMLSPDSVVEIV